MPKPKCTSPIRHCRNCEKHFDKEDKSKTCSDCGASRECRAKVEKGYWRCKHHGGPNPSKKFYGMERAVTSGRKSRFPLIKLASRYRDMTQDVRLTSMRPALKVVRERVFQLLDRIEENHEQDRIKNLEKAWKNYKLAQGSGSYNETVKAIAKLDEEFEKAYHDYKSWEEVYKALEMERRLSETEIKIIKDLHSMLTAEDAYHLVAQLLAAVFEVIDDPQQIQAIRYKFTTIIGDADTIDSIEPSREDDYEIRPSEMDREELLHTGDIE